MAVSEKPKTREAAIALAEMWDQLADNETDSESEYFKLRARAARYRAMAEKLPAEASIAKAAKR